MNTYLIFKQQLDAHIRAGGAKQTWIDNNPEAWAVIQVVDLADEMLKEKLKGKLAQDYPIPKVARNLRFLVLDISTEMSVSGRMEDAITNFDFLEELNGILDDFKRDIPIKYKDGSDELSYYLGVSSFGKMSQDLAKIKNDSTGKTFTFFEYVQKILTKEKVRAIEKDGIGVYKFTNKQPEFKDGATALSAKNKEIFINTLIETMEDGTFSKTYGTNFVIGKVIEQDYSIDDIGKYVANKVQEKIRKLEDVNIQINSDVILFNLESKTSGNELFWEIDPNLTLLSDAAGSMKRIRQAAFTKDKWDEIKQDLEADVTTFPSGVFGDNEDALNVLRNDESLQGKEITTYQFQLYTEIPKTFGEKFRNFFKSLLPNQPPAPKVPQDYVAKLIRDQYANFIFELLNQTGDGQPLETAIVNTRNAKFNDDFITQVYKLIAIDKELARRLQYFKDLADASSSRDIAADGVLSDEEINEIQVAAAGAFVTSDVSEGEKELTEEQIEKRQRFYKQCALLLNIHRLSSKYEQLIPNRQKGSTPDGPDKSKPYGGRFYRAKSKNTEQLMTNLVSSRDASYMFEIPPHIMTQLTPKFRLFKVFNDPDGKLRQTEFIFPTYADINREKNFIKNQGTTQEPTIKPFLSSQFDKGDGMGLKSFSLEFNGTNPAEARNDVKGKMTLFFQSFADFTRRRLDPNNQEYRFVDLIIQPTPDDNNKTNGVSISSLRQYEPTFYRIRVDMGYNIPENLEGISTDSDNNGESDLTRLQNALKAMNKSFYLCMIDHDFSIKNDGTVEMNFTYRAYLETALKSLRFDALTTPELAKRRIDNQSELLDVATSKKCTKDELRELQTALAASEEELVLNSLNSILTRMYSRGKIFTAVIDNEDRKQFLTNGFYRSCDLLNIASLVTSADDAGSGDLGVVLNDNFLSDDPDINFTRDIQDTNIQYFFFGDLLHTILDSLYDPDVGDKIAVGLENTKIVLGHFEFDPYQADGKQGSYNISNIPISVDFFGEWFKQNILNQKSTRRTFPVLNFIRNLSNHIVNKGLLESCVNRSVEQIVRFQTGQVSALTEDGRDPLGRLINNTDRVVNTDDERRNGKLPLKGDTGGSPNVNNFFHYIVLSCNGSALTYAGTGKYQEDIDKGRFHVEIGSNRGIVKNVQFSKTDMQYLREARFFRNGVDGLLQLSSVYTATIEMFGNTLFYPGMDLWINPYGFGGTELGNPNQGDEGTGIISRRSLSNILGIGGYHTITGVSINLTPQSFTTSIKSQHYYSGDDEKPEVSNVKSNAKNNRSDLIEQGVNENASTRDANFCNDVIVEQLNFSITAGNSGRSSVETGTATSPTAAANAASGASTAVPTIDDLVAQYPPRIPTTRNNVSGEYAEFTSTSGKRKLYFIPYNSDGSLDDVKSSTNKILVSK